MLLRPYQQSCLDAVNRYLHESSKHGVVSMPTGSGKTVIFAHLIKDWLMQWPDTRIAILAHRYELLEQAEAKLKAVWPEAPVGVWSSGLGRQEGRRRILVAGIQSIYKKQHLLDPFDVVILDECHLTPPTADTMYRTFLRQALARQPGLRVIGFTATPYRLDGGHLCGPDKFFSDIIFEANLRQLITDGYLCSLSTKSTELQLDTSGVHTRGGDFIPGELEHAVNTEMQTVSAVNEIVKRAGDRKTWLIFATGVAHAHAISAQLEVQGVTAPVVVGETDKQERFATMRAFDAGKLRAVVNVNCLTTGLDVTRIDCIAVLRPTQSTSLWVQMVGRGLRLHEGKTDCLVLDFGGNIARHGPLDRLRIRKKGDGNGVAPEKTCPECRETVTLGAANCPSCGHVFPVRAPRVDPRPSAEPIIGLKPPEWVEVKRISLFSHQKVGGTTPVLRVHYVYALASWADEWVCFQHNGYAQQKARDWWRAALHICHAPISPAPLLVSDAIERLEEMGFPRAVGQILVDANDKYPRVKGIRVREGFTNDGSEHAAGGGAVVRHGALLASVSDLRTEQGPLDSPRSP